MEGGGRDRVGGYVGLGRGKVSVVTGRIVVRILGRESWIVAIVVRFF